MISIDRTSKSFKDSKGRDLFFRGLNVIYKKVPYYPETTTFNPFTSFTEKDLTDLKEMGYNLIRLGVEWAGYEPKKGNFDIQYIEKIKEIVGNAKKMGIYTLLDFHQDCLAEKLCGEGIPNWSVKPSWFFINFPFPLQLNSFPDHPTPADCNSHTWSLYQLTLATASSYQALYDNVDGIQDSFIDFWKNVATEFKDEEYVIGYELINEPFAGDLYRDLLVMVPEYADYYNLQPMYERIQKKIREVDENHIIFFESITWDDFIPNGFTESPGGYIYQNRSALSYHYYKNVNFGDDLYFSTRIFDRDRLRVGSMLTEWDWCNTSNKTKSFINHFYDLLNIYKQSSIGWGYKIFANITGDYGCFYNDDGTINTEQNYFNSRTYPKAVAGKTDKIYFNEETSQFELEYKICAECGETEIYLNSNLRYVNGFNVVLNQNGVEYTSPNPNTVIITHNQDTDGKDLKISIEPKNKA